MSKYRNFVLFVILAAFWGSAFMAIKAGLEYFPPVLFAAIRYDVAGVLMLGYAGYVARKRSSDFVPRTVPQITLVFIGGALMIAGYHIFLFIGEQFTTSAVAAVVVSLSPILTTGFARLFLPDEHLTKLGILGLFLGLAGVGILMRPDPSNLLASDVVGKLLILGAAASFALGSVLTRRVKESLPIEVMEAWSMVIGAVLMHIVSFSMPSESIGAIVLNTESLLALFYLSVVSSAIGFLIYFDLLERLGPIEINLVSYVAPVFAALAGWVFLGEIIDVYTVVGFLVIFLGFVLIKREALAGELPHLRAMFSSR